MSKLGNGQEITHDDLAELEERLLPNIDDDSDGYAHWDLPLDAFDWEEYQREVALLTR